MNRDPRVAAALGLLRATFELPSLDDPVLLLAVLSRYRRALVDVLAVVEN